MNKSLCIQTVNNIHILYIIHKLIDFIVIVLSFIGSLYQSHPILVVFEWHQKVYEFKAVKIVKRKYYPTLDVKLVCEREIKRENQNA